MQARIHDDIVGDLGTAGALAGYGSRRSGHGRPVLCMCNVRDVVAAACNCAYHFEYGGRSVCGGGRSRCKGLVKKLLCVRECTCNVQVGTGLAQSTDLRGNWSVVYRRVVDQAQ